MKFITITTPNQEATIAVEAIESVFLLGSMIMVHRRSNPLGPYKFEFLPERRCRAGWRGGSSFREPFKEAPERPQRYCAKRYN